VSVTTTPNQSLHFILYEQLHRNVNFGWFILDLWQKLVPCAT